MNQRWKRKRLRLLVKVQGVIGYDRQASRCPKRRGGKVYGNSGKTIRELFEELREKEQNQADRFSGRLF